MDNVWLFSFQIYLSSEKKSIYHIFTEFISRNIEPE